jgi:hypothetical protein
MSVTDPRAGLPLLVELCRMTVSRLPRPVDVSIRCSHGSPAHSPTNHELHTAHRHTAAREAQTQSFKVCSTVVREQSILILDLRGRLAASGLPHLQSN